MLRAFILVAALGLTGCVSTANDGFVAKDCADRLFAGLDCEVNLKPMTPATRFAIAIARR